MKRVSAVLLVGLLLALPNSTEAAIISQTILIGSSATDQSLTLVFNKFDKSLGTLTEVDFTIGGTVSGTAAFENTSNGVAPSIVLNLRAIISLDRPDLSTLVTSIPIQSLNTTNVPIFDGNLDFKGTSGQTFNLAPMSVTNSAISSSTSDLALFGGPGSIALPFMAIGTSFANGPGNIAVLFATRASADVTVSYIYNDQSAVPEPSALALSVCGLIGLSGLIRRRRTR